jgi:hypothetical protein
MTTAALVRAAWKTNVWDNAALTALTSRAHNFDLMEIAEVSNAHAALMYHGQQINFFQYRVTKAREKQLSASRILYTISVHTQYFLEATTDTSGSNYNAVEDAIETLFTRVQAWSASWGSTVEYWVPQSEEPSLVLVELDDRPVWCGSYSFTGSVETTL